MCYESASQMVASAPGRRRTRHCRADRRVAAGADASRSRLPDAHISNAHLARPVEVPHFNVTLLPDPPARCGPSDQSAKIPPSVNEYFLRAERLPAGLRWTGLLRGHFEFGTLSLSRPSLILVRNREGRWNLERWLPPAKISARWPAVYGPRASATPANHLSRIDIDDGRVNFKILDEKLPFAFTSVSGVVEQVSPGRWQLQLEAQPWRSGAALQSAGTVFVRGDVAGTSARLQPAEIHVHWDQASLADLSAIVSRPGLRRTRCVCARCDREERRCGLQRFRKHPIGDWSYTLKARATQIHRWDLTERSDNPRMNVNLLGRLNVATGRAIADRIVVETSKSNLRGTALAAISANPSWEIHLDSAGVQAADVLAWYRAFQPDVDDAIFVEQYFTGVMTLRGWPLQLEDAAFSSEGGEARVPGISSPLRIGAIEGGRQHERLAIEPVHISYGANSGRAVPSGAGKAASAKRPAASEGRGTLNVGFANDFEDRAGRLTIDGRVERVEDVLQVAEAFGRPLNHGWDFAGAAGATLRWEWNDSAPRPLEWSHRRFERGTTGGRAESASGTDQDEPELERRATHGSDRGRRWIWRQVVGIDLAGDPADTDGNAKWNFQLHADHLDATELDRWIGPRARPGWLQRLLPSLLGGATARPTRTRAS